MLIIKNATLHNGVTPEPFVADILVKEGKIARIGPRLQANRAVGLIRAGCAVSEMAVFINGQKVYEDLKD